MCQTRSILTLTLFAAGAACSNAGTDPGDIPDAQDFLFEVEYVNYAWSFAWRGFHVDRNGDVWSYRLSSPWAHAGTGPFSKSELLEKYDVQPEKVGTVDIDHLRTMVAAVPAAAVGPLGDPVQRCADAGTVTFNAWTFDEATSRYTPVLLHMEGDVARANRSSEAGELTAWLRTLVPGYGIAGCEP